MKNPEKEEEYSTYTEKTEYVSKFKNISNFGEYQDVNSCENIVPLGYQNRNIILNNFRKIKEFLKHYKNDNTCNNCSHFRYLNFWMNKEMESNKMLNDSTIDLYNKFMKCDSDVKLIHKDKYDIYEIKYDSYKISDELYDLYSQCQGFINYKTTNTGTTCAFAKNEVLTFQKCQESIPSLQSLPQKPQSLLPLSSLVPIPVVAAMAGVLPILLFLYKFTPFGSSLQTRINKKGYILNSLEQDNHELSRIFETDNRNFGNRSYRIAYNYIDYS
ncbi:PIR Superfamily Protein [Plasmodium ovale wallikeri]|uniref:PIR Superfamily Protein n=1 Tax=Plasmodium ovale wallikeri TaxID=864142 RepID=A0A1A9ANS7_PLAOA|nr:PIR Superfamily Protein [Plasmodium ovale wallikeri]SBT59450.1 PIR Superfamily Protein [Plasmodium ovale wallikeri]